MEKLVHDAQRMTDSDTATSRCSRSPAPIVWFRLPLTPTTPRDVVPLAVLRDEAATVASQGAFSANDDGGGSGSLQSCAQKNEKLGMEDTGNGNPPPGSSQAPPNENPEPPEVEAGQDDGARSVTNAEKDDLQAAANVGEQHASSSCMPWQVIGPPVLKLTSLLRDASGAEEHEPGSSRRRPISWQWLQESCDWSACSCIHGCSA